MRALSGTSFLLALASGCAATAAEPPCDVLVAGGSLASLAAAVTAANVSRTASVCYLEITDWPGGQMTASGVPAVDFGPHNANRFNVPASLVALLWGPLMPGTDNLGGCWVSRKCFEIEPVMTQFVLPLLASFPNLRTYLSTAVQQATRDAASGNVTSVVAVRRTPRPGMTGWEQLLSQQVADWYDSADSDAFTKEVLTLHVAPGGVVIEATEFGDVLATAAGLPLAQGMEAPFENSTAASAITSCGQAITIPLWMQYTAAPAPSPDPVPAGDSGGEPFGWQGLNWTRVWTYRRSSTAPGTSIDEALPGDVSNQNVGGGNDYTAGYVFLPLDAPELVQQRSVVGAWRGGLNLTALAAAEQRAFAYYHEYKANTTAPAGVAGHLSLAPAQAGTAHGLSKMPYLRDARRSGGGLGGYKLTYHDLADSDPHNTTQGVRWPDTVAIGQYFYADIHAMDRKVCAYPAYLDHAGGSPVLPYFIPFRALTVAGAPNLLVAGKSLAQTFYASAATRLHPEEWSTGVAAGAAAALMHARGWDAAAALANVGALQAELESERVGSPLWWNMTWA